jgi:hypothetical protein
MIELEDGFKHETGIALFHPLPGSFLTLGLARRVDT